MTPLLLCTAATALNHAPVVQADIALSAAGSSPLLAAWGSQDHTRWAECAGAVAAQLCQHEQQVSGCDTANRQTPPGLCCRRSSLQQCTALASLFALHDVFYFSECTHRLLLTAVRSCQLLLSPVDLAPSLPDSTTTAAQHLGSYLAAAAAVGQAHGQSLLDVWGSVAVPGVQTHSDAAGVQQQHQLARTKQQQGGLKALLDGAAHPQDWQQLGWHMDQQQQQQQGLQLLLWQQQQMQQSYPHQQLLGIDWPQGVDPLLHHLVPFQQQQQSQEHQQQRPGRCIPVLDLSRVKVGSSQPVKNLPDGGCVSDAEEAREAELCLDAGSIREHHLHPNAPLQDSRCYIYRAVGGKVGL